MALTPAGDGNIVSGHDFAGRRVVKNPLMTATVLLLALGAVGPAVAQTPSLVGVWRGQGHQTPAGSTASDWSIEMTIRAGGGAIEYPSLACGGTLTELSKTATSAQYRETITHGSGCVNGGLITVNFVKGKLAWTWEGTDRGTQYHAIANLTR
jgi:hypothetical protein